MKKYNSFLKFLLIAFTALFIIGCVHDDKYDDPNLDTFQCQDLTANITIAQVKALHPMTGTPVRYVFPADSPAILEGYVSSTDETGNIYKTIYIQDAPVNPTQGFVISVDAVSTYTKFPQGTKIYIKLKGMALGTYGALLQLGIEDARAIATGRDAVSRIPEKQVPSVIFRSCTIRENIIPKVLTLQQMTANDNLLGALIQVNDAEFDSKILCSTYAPNGETVDRQINDPTLSATSRVIRNSGFASFSNQTLPAGKGKLIGIFSKFNATYQLYVNKAEDLADMKNFPRKDGITKDPCAFDPAGLTFKTIAEAKQLFSGSLTQINSDIYVKAKVTANDETGNLYKYIYVEDASGGIRININKLDLFQDERFRIGKEIFIKLKNLYIGNVNGELQIGQPFNGNAGQIAEVDVFKFFFDSKQGVTAVSATEKTINQLTAADVGRWIKIKDVQYIESDLGEPYASGGVTNRTLKDCSGNQIILRTSNFATFAAREVDSGKGDVYAILSVFNGTYQLWIPYQRNADFDNPRCDNAVAPKLLFSEEFGTALNTNNWTAVNVAGPQVWATSNQGTGTNYYAVMNGFANNTNNVNEDWLISKEIDLAGYTQLNLTFDSDVRYNGTPLKAFATDNYTGNPATTNWTELSAIWDTNTGAFGFVASGNVSLNAFANKKVRIAFKYVSTASAANTWEIDNVKVKAKP